MNDPSVLALGATVLQSDINSPAAQAAGIKSPYPGFTGQRRTGAAKVSAVPEHPVARRADGRESVPRPGTRARAALLARASRPGWHTHTRSCITTARRARRATTGSTQRVQNPGGPARMVAERRRYAARVPDRLHLGSARLRQAGPRASRRRSLPAGTSAACSATKAGGRSTSRWPTISAASCSTARSGPNRVGGRRCRGVAKRRLRSERRPLLQSERRGRILVRCSSATRPGATERCADSRPTART